MKGSVCQTHKLTKNPCEERSDEAAEKHAHIRQSNYDYEEDEWAEEISAGGFHMTPAMLWPIRAYKQYNENSACRKSPRCTVVSYMLFHSYGDISLFVSCVDIPVSLGNLFQRIASTYDRFYLPRLNKLFEEN